VNPNFSLSSKEEAGPALQADSLLYIMDPVNRLIILRSSAGSGKTYALVRQYLFLALSDPDRFRHILAITFTNKAMEEMKARILSALSRFRSGHPSPLRDDLCRALDVPPDELDRRARRLLAGLLHGYSDFAVGTIDRFFLRMVRSLAREFDLPVRFDISVDTETAAREVTRRLIALAGKPGEAGSWLMDFAMARLDDDKGWNIEPAIRELAAKLFDEDFRSLFTGRAMVNQAFALRVVQARSDSLAALRDGGTAFFRHLKDHGLEVADLNRGIKGIAGYFAKLADPDLPVPPVSAFCHRLLADPSELARKADKQRETVTAFSERLVVPLIEKCLSATTAYHTADELLKLLYVAGMMHCLDDTLTAYRHDEELLLLGDVYRLLDRFLGEADTAFIYEKTGNRYHHLLIDEFQDTSLNQWHHLLPFATHALGSGYSVMAVGDAKQSIYRWRGGNLYLLHRGIEESLAPFRAITEKKALMVNYRSRREIIDFNNRFFMAASAALESAGYVSAAEASDGIYHRESVEQRPADDSLAGGRVDAVLYEKRMGPAQGEPGAVDRDDGADDEPEFEGTRAVPLELTVAAVRQMLDAGFREGDIAILVQRNEEAAEVASALAGCGITRFTSADSLKLTHSPKVQLMISLLQWIAWPDSSLVRARCIYYYGIVSGTGPMPGAFGAAGDRDRFLAALPPGLAGLADRMPAWPLQELCEFLARTCGLFDRPCSYVQGFLDGVIEFCADHPSPTVSGFLDWWTDRQDDAGVVAGAGINAIRILTIHRSKGLEFPVVILPFTGWSLFPNHKTTLWVHCDEPPYDAAGRLPVKATKKLEETYFREDFLLERKLAVLDNLNLLYVAFTRARERLIVFCPEERDPKKFGRASHLIHRVLSGDAPPPAHVHRPEDGQLPSFGGERTVAAASGDEPPPGTAGHPTAIALDAWVIPGGPLPVEAFGAAPSREPDPAAAYGTILHRIMASIRNEADAGSALARDAAARRLPAGDRDAIEKAVYGVMDLCRPHGWFSGSYTIRTEAEVMLPDGSVLRPDRIMLSGGRAVVVDYKTGKPDPHHAMQVRKYMQCIGEAGFTETTGFLLYMNEMKLEHVDGVPAA